MKTNISPRTHFLLSILLLLITPLSYSQCDILGYPFNDNANDTSSNGFHATVYGATLTTDRFGNPNSAYEFNGQGAWLDAGNILQVPQESAITISTWFYPTTINNNNIRHTGISIGDKASGELMLRTGYPGDNRFQAAISGSGGNMTSVKSNTSYNLNQWYHIVAIYTNNKVELWVDGVKQGDSTKVYGGASLSNVPSSSPLWIGKSLNPNRVKYFQGKIDDIKILRCEADSTMIQRWYNYNGWTKSKPCVILGYPFDGNANDTSSNGLHATVHGAALTTDRFGNPNSAYSFNGQGDFMDAGNIIDLSQQNALTISAWFYPTAIDNNSIRHTGLSIGDKYNGELMLRTGYPGDQRFQAALSTSNNYSMTSVKGNSSYNLNQWYHLVAVYTDNSVKLWVNGVQQLDSSRISGGAPLYCAPPTANLWIGMSANPNNTKYFQGKIDDIVILSCPADSAMIQSLYSAQIGVSEHSIKRNHIAIYPNPTKGLLNVELESGNQIEEVIIYNQLGQSISQIIATSNTNLMQLEISNLPAGIYLVKAVTGDGVLTERIIKE